MIDTVPTVAVAEESCKYTKSSYMGDALFTPRETLAEYAEEALLESEIEFDTMIGTGLSASLVIPSMAEHMKCNWAIVRKEMDNTHGSKRIEGRIGHRVLFVDDLIASGRTGRSVMKSLWEFCKLEQWIAHLVGGYMYHENEVFTLEELEDEGINDPCKPAGPVWKGNAFNA